MEQTTNEANVQKKGGARLKKSSRPPLLIPGIVVGVLAAAYLGLCAYAGSLDTFYPSRCINGVNVGKLTAMQAQDKLESEFPSRPVTLVDENGQDLADLTLADLGYTPELFEGDAQFWLADQQRDSFLRRGWSYLNILTGRWPGGWNWPDPDQSVLDNTVAHLSATLSAPAVDAEYTLEGDVLTIRKAKDGRAVDEDALRTAFAGVSGKNDDTHVITVPFTTVTAKTLTAKQVHDEIAGEMKNAGYDAKTQSITAERLGADFDVTAAQAALDAAEPGDTITVQATLEYPKVTAKELESVLFRDVLGQARTHVGGTAARISNVKLAASAFNGVVLNSGETFSYNGTVGQRTAAKGYKPAPAYVKGETVDEIGGGVCQPSSTLYKACLLADMEITERYAHRYVPSYIDWGMDATVSWNGPDYKFTNNTDYPVKIVTTYANNYLTVQLVGTKTSGVTVKMTNQVLSTTPWKTVYEQDDTLAPGTEQVKVTPYTGYKVVTFQSYYDAGGKLISSHQEATSNYKVRDKVILQGPPKETESYVNGGAEIPAQQPETPVTEPPVTEPELPIQEPEAPVVEIPETPVAEGSGTIVVDLTPGNG